MLQGFAFLWKSGLFSASQALMVLLYNLHNIKRKMKLILVEVLDDATVQMAFMLNHHFI